MKYYTQKNITETKMIKVLKGGSVNVRMNDNTWGVSLVQVNKSNTL